MRLLVLVLSFLTLSAAVAQDSSPEVLVRKVTTDVLDSIKADKQLQAGDRKKALALAEAKVLPHVDFREAAKIAAGRAWPTATTEQQESIVQEFRRMLVRVYSNAIDVYRGQTMKVMPVHMGADANETTVRNQYLREGRQPVAVDYAMHKTAEGWKIYDITVEGISLVLAYRSEFETIVRSSGVDGLIKRMREKNA